MFPKKYKFLKYIEAHDPIAETVLLTYFLEDEQFSSSDLIHIKNVLIKDKFIEVHYTTINNSSFKVFSITFRGKEALYLHEKVQSIEQSLRYAKIAAVSAAISAFISLIATVISIFQLIKF